MLYGPRLDAVIGMLHEVIETQVARLVHNVASDDISICRPLVLDLAVHQSEPLVQLNDSAERQLVKCQADPADKQTCMCKNITSESHI